MANLRTRDDLITEVLVRLETSTTAGFYTDTIMRNWWSQASQWATAYKKWPFTEGRVSTTWASLVTDEDALIVGEYPEGWKPDSIRQLTVDGKRLDKKNYFRFRRYLEDNASTTERIFSDFGLRYYINPNMDITGTVTAFGQYTPVLDLTDETGLTVFSDRAPEGNEAIVEKMVSWGKLREQKQNESLAHDALATKALNELWEKVKDEQFGYQDTKYSDGMFTRIDVVEGLPFDDRIDTDQF